MKLLTAANRKALPPLYSQEAVADPIAQVKFFTPDGACTWYALEFDGVDRFFGWADLGDPDCAELGYFLLSDLARSRGLLGLPIERDRWFRPTPLSAVKRARRVA